MLELKKRKFIYFHFFLNQQFITQDVVAVHGSYFVITCIRTNKTKERKEKKREK